MFIEEQGQHAASLVACVFRGQTGLHAQRRGDVEFNVYLINGETSGGCSATDPVPYPRFNTGFKYFPV